MRAKLFLTILISYISIIFADSTAISGTIKDYHSNIPLSNVMILITRIGDNISVEDTVFSSSDGSYLFNYLFELENYKKKYKQIRVKPLNNNTHWFHAERYNYTYKDQTSANLVGISNTSTDSTKENTIFVSYPSSSEGHLVDTYKIIFTQTNEDSTSIKVDTINANINSTLSFYTNAKRYKYFKMDLSSNKWNILEDSYYWDYSQTKSTNLFLRVSPVNLDAVKISGKVDIHGTIDPHILLSDRSNHDIKINSEGEFTHYFPKGWSGTLQLLNPNYSWTSKEPVFTDLQEDQILTLSIKRNTNTVSGCVSIDKGDSIKNVFIDFGKHYVVTDSLGFYSIEIDHQDSFQVIPFKEGYTFNPSYLTDLHCVSDINLNITATVIKEVVITGAINSGSRGDIDSILILFSGTGNGSCWTDVNGNFSHSLRYDWSGTITPIKQEKIFNPPLIAVESLDSDTIISAIKVKDTITQTSTCDRPIKLDRITQPEYEIVIYNVSGKLIGKAKNTVLAKMLIKNAPGFYVFQRAVKNSIIKAKKRITIK